MRHYLGDRHGQFTVFLVIVFQCPKGVVDLLDALLGLQPFRMLLLVAVRVPDSDQAPIAGFYLTPWAARLEVKCPVVLKKGVIHRASLVVR